MATDLLSELLPEMAGEVRRWLSTIDRVRLQRVSRQLHARDPGPLLSRVWQDIARQCVRKGVGSLVFEMIDTGVHEGEVPSEVALDDMSLLLRWYRLPVTCLKEGAPIHDASFNSLRVTKESSGKSAWRYLRMETTRQGLDLKGEWNGRSAAAGRTLLPTPPGLVTFYGYFFELVANGTFSDEYRDDEVLFKHAAYDGATRLDWQWKIPLNETCEQ